MEVIQAGYERAHPRWRLQLGRCDDGPWVKALAIADALRRCDAEIVVVADADVWTDGLDHAVTAVRDGAPWAIPHRGVHRLTEAATARYAPGGPWEPLELCERSYLGVEGGGIVVARRDVYDNCPLDPRFAGWGSEDEAWGIALRTLHGPPVRIKAPLVHLWHPPQPRATRAFGSQASRELRKRYVRASGDRTAMTALIEEAKEP